MMSTELPFGVTFADLPEYDLAQIRKANAKDWIDKLREKRWYYVGVFHPEVFVGVAIIRVGPLASAFAYAFDRKEKSLFGHNMLGFPVQVRFDLDPCYGWLKFRAFRGSITIQPRQSDGFRRLTTALTFPNTSLDVQLNYGWSDHIPQALCLLAALANDRFAFTRKMVGHEVSGHIRFPGRQIEISPGDAVAVEDWTIGFHPRETFWNWATGAGVDQCGRTVSFNFSGGVYTVGEGENVVWLDGVPRLFGPVRFVYNPSKPLKTWRITAQDGSVEMLFTPEGLRRADQDYILVASRFVQVFGQFTGTFIIDGERIQFQNANGVVEEHFARW
ncbi:MAG: DUF2804 domain-containing protein [Deltaproteobacteria bacterium]|nr:MAG: DUF2804 domain-containing protein [Deltaproteobacteria bacterium]